MNITYMSHQKDCVADCDVVGLRCSCEPWTMYLYVTLPSVNANTQTGGKE